jgi:3,4-dihydroxy 2-butanone 4-phosphate synthase/GTP cyclohydrolase II
VAPAAFIAPTAEIVAELAAGRMVILVDAEDRENEGDLVVAAEHCTPEAINFMAKHGRGLICLTLTEAHCQQLRLPLMVRDNRTPHGTAFTMSIEAAQGVTTGISAYDRSHTVRIAAARDARPEDIVQPGHIFPLMAQNGGVLVRAGHTEAGCDLSAMAGLTPAAVICEILKDDGTMARLDDLIAFAQTHGLKIGTIADLIQHRSRNESLVERISERQLETPQGRFTLVAFADRVADEVHLALFKPGFDAEREALVRVHEPLSVLDFLLPSIGHHAFSIDDTLAAIVRFGCGALVLMHRGEGGAELRRRLAPEAATAPAARKWDPRLYGIGAQILRDIGVRRMRLLTSRTQMPSMSGFDLEITGFVADSSQL